MIMHNRGFLKNTWVSAQNYIMQRRFAVQGAKDFLPVTSFSADHVLFLGL